MASLGRGNTETNTASESSIARHPRTSSWISFSPSRFQNRCVFTGETTNRTIRCLSASAFFDSRFFKNKRIVLYDTLIKQVRRLLQVPTVGMHRMTTFRCRWPEIDTSLRLVVEGTDDRVTPENCCCERLP